MLTSTKDDIKDRGLDRIRQFGLIIDLAGPFSITDDDTTLYTNGPNIAMSYKGFNHIKSVYDIRCTMSMTADIERSDPIVSSKVYLNGTLLSSSISSVSRHSKTSCTSASLILYGEFLIEVILSCSSHQVGYIVTHGSLDLIRVEDMV